MVNIILRYILVYQGLGLYLFQNKTSNMKCLFQLIVISFISCILTACDEKIPEQELITIGMPKGKKLAAFTALAGFETKQLALSTNELNVTGLALVQYLRNEKDTVKHRIWQHPSWKKLGHMGPITTDANGTAYTAPIPVINTLSASHKHLNTIFRVENSTGELKPFLTLPITTDTINSVPFGIIGLYFDDHGQKLYASTVNGSTREKENGVIYVIDTKSKEIIDKLEAIDAFGLFVAGYSGQKRLYYGLARKSEVASIRLNKEGVFKGNPQSEFLLSQLGPRGSDKVRRMRIDKYGNLFVFGVDFNYNLSAQTIKPETVYRFNFIPDLKKWQFVEVLP
jgi:hypothetical protein